MIYFANDDVATILNRNGNRIVVNNTAILQFLSRKL